MDDEYLPEEEMKHAMERTVALSDLIGKMPWMDLDHITIRWYDDYEQSSQIGSTDPLMTRQPTFETIHIEIVAKPGTLPVPRKGKIVDEGEMII